MTATYNMKVYLKSGNIVETDMIFENKLDNEELKETVELLKTGFSIGGASDKNEGVSVNGDSIEALTLTPA